MLSYNSQVRSPSSNIFQPFICRPFAFPVTHFLLCFFKYLLCLYYHKFVHSVYWWSMKRSTPSIFLPPTIPPNPFIFCCFKNVFSNLLLFSMLYFVSPLSSFACNKTVTRCHRQFLSHALWPAAFNNSTPCVSWPGQKRWFFLTYFSIYYFY